MRPARAAIIAAVLILTTAACQMDVIVDARIAVDGSGTFALRFAADKELVDLARNTGQDALTPLTDLTEDLRRQGWTVTRSDTAGGLSVGIERRFANTDELNRALADLEEQQAGSSTPAFFHVVVARSSGFLRSKTSFAGAIDLRVDNLLQSSDLPTSAKNALRPIVEQAAGEFFRFTVRVALPGDVSSSSGDPDEVRGGTITWTPALGKQVTLTASSSAYNPTALVAIGAPVVILAALLVMLLRRRRLRARA